MKFGRPTNYAWRGSPLDEDEKEGYAHNEHHLYPEWKELVLHVYLDKGAD